MDKRKSSWALRWEVATKPSIVKRALRVALLVGTILMIINHGDKILMGNVTSKDFIKMAFTYLVPYCVSTYSSVLTWLEDNQGN